MPKPYLRPSAGAGKIKGILTRLTSGNKGPKQRCLKMAIAVTGDAQRYLESADGGTE